MTKLDPDHPTIRLMLGIILVYGISSYILNNFIQKDYDYDDMKKKLIEAKKSKDLEEPVKEIQRVSKIRFYLLFAVCAVLFLLYVYYKVQTDKSESTAIFLLMIIGLTGKLIEKLGLANCLTIPIIDPKGAPSNVLLFDMFYTNFFAYFLDFLYAFVAVMVLSKGGSLISMFKTDKFKNLVHNNLPIFSDGKFRFENIIRFLIYIGTIIVFWNWGSIIRPKITLLLHRFLGIPIVDKNQLDLEDEKGEEKEGHELVTTISSIGILSAATVEGLIFTGLLFPMRKFFIYNLGNSADYHSNKMSVLAKFVGLVMVIPICIILVTKYTFASNNPQEYKFQKMTSIVLGGYILIPTIMLMIQSLFKIKVLDLAKKHKNISTIMYIIVPIIIGLIMNLTGKNSVSYITDNPEEEKIVESYMSDVVSGKCDESENIYKYAVAIVTILMMVCAFAPMMDIHKLQPITGILYFALATAIIKIIYMFQDNYEPYNILNPMRHTKETDEIDLDSTVSIGASMGAILISVSMLVLFRKFNQK